MQDGTNITPELEQYLLSGKAIKDMYAGLGGAISACHTDLLQTKQATQKNERPEKYTNDIERTFKDSARVIVYRLLKDANLGDIEVYMEHGAALAEENKELAPKIKAVNAKLKILEEAINKTFKDINALTDEVLVMGLKRTIKTKRIEDNWTGLIVAALIGVASALASLVIGVLALQIGTAAALGVLLTQPLSKEVYDKEFVGVDIDNEKLKLRTELGDVLKANVKELRISLKDFIRGGKDEAQLDEKSVERCVEILDQILLVKDRYDQRGFANSAMEEVGLGVHKYTTDGNKEEMVIKVINERYKNAPPNADKVELLLSDIAKHLEFRKKDTLVDANNPLLLYRKPKEEAFVKLLEEQGKQQDPAQGR